jgi:hypothetical protein
MTEENIKKVTFSLPYKEYRKVKRECGSEDIPVSHWIRNLIEEKLKSSKI